MKTLNPTAVMGPYDEAREELTKIAGETGVLSPKIIVEAARDEKNPLHDYFLWDDTEAAARYRLNQASLLIRRIKIEILKPNTATRQLEIKTTRKFVSPKSTRGKDGGYQAIEKVLDDETLKADLLETAKSELLAIRKKYENLVELASVWNAIDGI